MHSICSACSACSALLLVLKSGVESVESALLLPCMFHLWPKSKVNITCQAHQPAHSSLAHSLQLQPTPTHFSSLQLAPIIWNGQLLAPRNALRNQSKLFGIAPYRTRLRLVALSCNGSDSCAGKNNHWVSQPDPIASIGYLLITFYRCKG